MAVIIKEQESTGILIDELLEGKVIVSGTNTIYGFLSKCSAKEAFEKIFDLKDRPRTKQLPVLVSSFQEFEKYTKLSSAKNKQARQRLAEGCTVIVKLPLMFHAYFQGYKTIGFRIPKGPVLDLIKVVGPCWSTSANMAGEEPMNDPEMINEIWGDHIGFIYQTTGSGAASKIVDLTGMKSVVVRDGKTDQVAEIKEDDRNRPKPLKTKMFGRLSSIKSKVKGKLTKGKK